MEYFYNLILKILRILHLDPGIGNRTDYSRGFIYEKNNRQLFFDERSVPVKLRIQIHQENIIFRKSTIL